MHWIAITIDYNQCYNIKFFGKKGFGIFHVSFYILNGRSLLYNYLWTKFFFTLLGILILINHFHFPHSYQFNYCHYRLEQYLIHFVGWQSTHVPPSCGTHYHLTHYCPIHYNLKNVLCKAKVRSAKSLSSISRSESSKNSRIWFFKKLKLILIVNKQYKL